MTQYLIERCSGAGCSNFAQAGTSVGTTFNNTGLTQNTSYSYRVRATDASSNLSGYSNTATTTTLNPDTQAPTAPSGLAATAISGTQINLSWTASTDNVAVTQYLIESCQGAGCANFAQIGTSAGTTFSNTGLTINASYSYRVRATDAAANLGGYSNTATTTTQNPDTQAPTAPSGLAATAISTTQINLSWTASTDNVAVTQYQIERCSGAGCSNFAQIGTSTGTTFNNTGLTQSTSYSYRIRATDAATNLSGYSNTATATTLTPDTQAPTAPSGLAATGVTSSQVNLNWSASSDNVGVTQYLIESCQGSGCSNFTQVGTSTGLTFSHTGLVQATLYRYRVRARDAAANMSGYSNIANGTTTGPQLSEVGQWTSPIPWPVIGIHATLMPDGKVLTWEDENATVPAQIWDPATSTFTPVPYYITNLFCSGHTVLPDGRIMVAGGHIANWVGTNTLTFFQPATQTWSAGPNMSYARWYPNVTALPDGRQLVVSGSINCENCNADTPELYDPATNTWTLLNSATLHLPIYPHLFTLPDGRVIVTGSYELPVVTRVLDLNTFTWSVVDPTVVDGGSAVMYRPGKILKTGTSANSDPPFFNAAPTAYVLDMTQGSPAWRATNPMAFGRSYHNTTMLPDGNVLTTGGDGYTDPYNLSTATMVAEMWSPVTEQWTRLASAQIPRVYHSSALLLADGRVLVSGGGEYGPGSPSQLTAEIYSPPYLFKGARPTVTSVPSTLQFGQAFQIATPDAANIASVALIRLGSVTHAFDENQRYIPLEFTAGSGTLTATAPANANIAPPGHYLLFIVNTNGVPSVAPVVQFPIGGTTLPTTPGNLAGNASTGRVDLSWTASTGTGGIAAYDIHRSTTANFTASPANKIGQTTGTTYSDTNFTTSGTYYYLVTARDLGGNESLPSNQLTQTVSADLTPPTVSVTAPAGGANVSGNVAVTATATDDVAIASVQFYVDGAALGSPVTAAPYTASWNTFATANGSHTLTAAATNGAQLSTTSAPVSVTVNNSTPANIAFVQSNYAVPASGSVVTLPFQGAQTAGNLNVVVIGWSNTTSAVNSVTDSRGNVYTLAVGPTANGSVESQSIYYARNIVSAPATGNSVTVTFSTSVPYPDVRILEYSGLDTVSPLEGTAASTGNSATSSSTSVTTSVANVLLVGANYVATMTTNAGAGYTSRMVTVPDGNIVEDRIVSAVGTYNATATLSGAGNWVMQLVAFRAAGSPGPGSDFVSRKGQQSSK